MELYLWAKFLNTNRGFGNSIFGGMPKLFGLDQKQPFEPCTKNVLAFTKWNWISKTSIGNSKDLEITARRHKEKNRLRDRKKVFPNFSCGVVTPIKNLNVS